MADKKDLTEPYEKLGVRPTSMGSIPKILDIVWAMKPRLTPCLVGHSGIGKTPVVQQWAQAKGGFVRILNFGHLSQEEVSMIMFSEDASSFDFVPPGFMLELNEKAEEKGCAVLFLDEFNRGDKALVNALFTLTDERRIHNFRLHDNVMVVAAMNPSDGAYLVNEAEKDHAIRKRLNFIYCQHDIQSWLKYTKKSGWHPLVPAFIKSATTFLYDTGARDAGKCFPCPSNWEKVSRILEAAQSTDTPLTDTIVSTLIEGQIGSVAATKFMDFVADQNTLIQPSEILTDYKEHSVVRQKVASLLNCRIDSKTGEFVEKSKQQNRASVINELNQGVALELFSSQPEPAKIAANLARYIGDLPNELLSAFLSHHVLDASKACGPEGEKYLSKVSQAMQGHPAYQRRLTDIMKALREYKKKANLIPT